MVFSRVLFIKKQNLLQYIINLFLIIIMFVLILRHLEYITLYYYYIKKLNNTNQKSFVNKSIIKSP